MVVANAGRADPGVCGKARRLGPSGLASLPEDARETPVGPLGGQGGVETAPQAGGRIPPWDCRVPGRTHHAEGPPSLMMPKPARSGPSFGGPFPQKPRSLSSRIATLGNVGSTALYN